MFEKTTVINSNKRVYLAVLASILILILPCSASGDRIELKNGQVFEGDIIGEEDARIQMKLDGSGTRLWFSRDQISSIEKSSAPEGDQEQGDEADSKKDDIEETPAAEPEDDKARAQKLLDSLKKQPEAGEQEMALPESPVVGAEYAGVTLELFTDYQ